MSVFTPRSFLMELVSARNQEALCYTLERAAELLGCTRRHVVNLRKRGELRFVRLGRRVVIRHADLVDLLARNAQGGPA